MASLNLLGLIPAKGKAVQRRLPSWIDGFFEYTSNLPASPLFRKWAGLSAVAGALERKVWCTPFGDPPLQTFPPSYIILTAGAGVGKTVVTSVVAKLWRELPDHYLAPSNVSRAALMDTLADAKRKIIRIGEVPPFMEFNSLNVAANELGVFITEWDRDFLSHLTDIWDGDPYHERKRSNSVNVKIDRPSLNLIGCTTPKWLMDTMPAGAWEFGFTSRTIFVYSGEKILKDLVGLSDEMPEINQNLFVDLTADLKIIGDLYGKFRFEPEAAKAFRFWHLADGPPAPTHPKLERYNSRRSAHLVKICMILSASERSDLFVSLEIYQKALAMLLEMEVQLPNIFRAMTAGGDSAAMNDLQFAMQREYAKTQKPIAEGILVAFLKERVPSHNVMRVIEIMIRSTMIKQVVDGSKTAYVPMARKLVD